MKFILLLIVIFLHGCSERQDLANQTELYNPKMKMISDSYGPVRSIDLFEVIQPNKDQRNCESEYDKTITLNDGGKIHTKKVATITSAYDCELLWRMMDFSLHYDIGVTFDRDLRYTVKWNFDEFSFTTIHGHFGDILKPKDGVDLGHPINHGLINLLAGMIQHHQPDPGKDASKLSGANHQ